MQDELQSSPSVLFALHMFTAPSFARVRLVGVAGISKPLVSKMELEHRLPPRMKTGPLDSNLRKITEMIIRLADIENPPRLVQDRDPSEQEVRRTTTIVADRFCGANTDPIVRNAQEKRQLGKIVTFVSIWRFENHKEIWSKRLSFLRTLEYRSHFIGPGFRVKPGMTNCTRLMSSCINLYEKSKSALRIVGTRISPAELSWTR